jgi:photosystem II stability/assembly factor-like uncharacterized protein
MKKFIPLFFSLFTLTGFSQTSSWSALTSGTTNILLGVSAPSKDTCYVCGTAGIIKRTVNGGLSWSTQTSGTTENLAQMTFIDNNKGFIVGDNGIVLKTINAGATWTSLSLTTSTLRAVYFYNNTLGFIAGVGGLIKRTTDGGTTWTTVSSGTTQQLSAVYFTSSTTGYASGFGGTIIKTTDGGLNWSPLTSGITSPLGIIQFTSSTNGIVIGDGDVIRQTSNSGTSWSATSNPSSGNVLTGMDFFNSTDGFIVGGNVSSNTGIILTSTNSGNTWSSYNPGSARLTKVDFVNANVAYAVGLNGTILKYSSNVGIDETGAIDKYSFVNYPNPFSTSTTIDFSSYNFSKEVTIDIFDITGRMVRSIKGNQLSKITIQKDDLVTGTYIYKVFDGGAYTGSGKLSVK